MNNSDNMSNVNSFRYNFLDLRLITYRSWSCAKWEKLVEKWKLLIP